MSLELQSLLPYPNSCPGTSPHQQGRDTKMAMLSFGGIDVSKDRLDIMVLPDEQCSWVSNDAAGWAELVEQLRGSSITAIGVEASVATSVVSSGPCSRLACLCARSIRSSCGSSLRPVGLWPRTIGLMRGWLARS